MKTPKVHRGVSCLRHGKLSYPTRKIARHWARVYHRGEAVGEFWCEHTQMWHLGHHPQALRQGIIGRADHMEGVRRRMEKVRDLKATIWRLECELAAVRAENEAYRVLEQEAEQTLRIIRAVREAFEGDQDD